MKSGHKAAKGRATGAEDALLRRIAGAAWMGKDSGLRVGIGDDAALFAPSAGHETVLTCDWFLEGVHFLREKHPAKAVGWKCLARAVSDIAAMGGVPRCFLLGLALPETHTGRWLKEFLGGLRRASRRLGCTLAGGDTTRTGQILIHVTAVGEVRRGEGVLRAGARPGDTIFVSGTLGGAELGLRLLRSKRQRIENNDPRLRRHLYPEPRLALGQWLAEKRLATAMMDISDGLSTDLARLCAASQAGARIIAGQIPLGAASVAARELRVDPLELALHGGEDYELLFTARKGQEIPRTYHGVPLTAIGEITAKREIVLARRDGKIVPLRAGGWDPFARRETR
jgi:thiamine-monophosphate kinase